jgi:hypothetical protein
MLPFHSCICLALHMEGAQQDFLGGWIDRLIYRWMGGWMDGWMNEYLPVIVILVDGQGRVQESCCLN